MLTSSQKLSAIAWKCDQVNLSYGKLINSYTPAQIREIYNEYEKKLILEAPTPEPPRPKRGRKPKIRLAVATE